MCCVCLCPVCVRLWVYTSETTDALKAIVGGVDGGHNARSMTTCCSADLLLVVKKHMAGLYIMSPQWKPDPLAHLVVALPFRI